MPTPTDDCQLHKDFYNNLYAITYTIILVPGLIGNVLALWVFRCYIRETKKAVIFMINLAVADLLQVLSLPLRIFYYLHKSWPFGKVLCMFCFYLKYVNMYASIYFLVCISIRRYLFLMHPFKYNDYKRKWDIYASIVGWLIVCICCLPFPLLRDAGNPEIDKCFVDLPMAQNLGNSVVITMVTLAEITGFVLPLLIVFFCSWKTSLTLKETNTLVNDNGEKRKAFKMILTCAIVFLVCFGPYHLSFPLDFLAKANKLSCNSKKAASIFHPVAICLASLNSCVDPVIYYFTTDEFKRRLSRQDLQESIQLQTKIYSSSQSRSECQG
ncbi:probable G-protein coupled receptor 174 [Protopterus annectens]|uniref:probable G-protein coupled receptor 174 n=1 Tax=Protopterus annectens TaxID=7888 RepID=UPI001CFA95F3|nr:probable G-protein coupled receptor 174 [Protopterus annectens]